MSEQSDLCHQYGHCLESKRITELEAERDEARDKAEALVRRRIEERERARNAEDRAEKAEAKVAKLEEALQKAHDFVENHEPQGVNGWKHRGIREEMRKAMHHADAASTREVGNADTPE